MSNIQRSKSTPHVQNALSSAGVPRSFSHTELDRQFLPPRPHQLPPRSLSYRGSHRVQQQAHPEDPFNLGGFFPTSPREESHDLAWSWLRPSEEVEDEAESAAEEPALEGAKLAVNEALRQAERQYADAAPPREQIFIEDTDRVRLLSPYSSDDGAVDDQSLYMHLRDLRAKELENMVAAMPLPRTTRQKVTQQQCLFFEDDEQIRSMYKVF